MPVDLQSLFGGGGAEEEDPFGGISSKEANVMSLLEAMRGVQEAGMRKTASPIGSIAQALIPIFAAPIQARQMEQKSQLQSLLLRAQLAKLLQGSSRDPDEIDLNKAKADQARATAEEKRAAAKLPYGGKSPTTAGMALEVGGSPAEALKIISQMGIDRAAASAGAGAAARIPFQKEMADYNAQIAAQKKAPLPQKITTNFSTMATNLETLDSVLADVAAGKIQRSDALKSTITGGMLSNPTLRDYSNVKNNITRLGAGLSQTKTELQNIAREAPSEATFFSDPKGFVRDVAAMRNRIHRAFAREARYFGDRYDTSEAQIDIDRLAPPEAPAGFTSLDARESGIGQLIQRTGWTRARAEKAFDDLMSAEGAGAE